MLICRNVFITDLFIAVTQSLVGRVSCEGKNSIAIPVAMHCSMVMGAQEPLPRRWRKMMMLKAANMCTYLTRKDQWFSHCSCIAHGEVLKNTHLSLRQVLSLIWMIMQKNHTHTESDWQNPANWTVSTEIPERSTLNWEKSQSRESYTAFTFIG